MNQNFIKGDRVLYSPSHVLNGEPDRANEMGIIKRIEGSGSDQKIWVVFNGDTGQLCPLKTLIKWDSIFYELDIESKPDSDNRQRFRLLWPAFSMGVQKNLIGMAEVHYFTDFEEMLASPREKGTLILALSDLQRFRERGFENLTDSLINKIDQILELI